MQVDVTSLIAILTLGSLVTGGILWLVKTTLKPLQVALTNNTVAVEKLTEVVERQDDRLDDHEVRLTRIETRHELHHPGEGPS